MTDSNLPDGVRSEDLPGNSESECAECEAKHWAEDMRECPFCELRFCDDCYIEHLELHDDDEDEEDDDEELDD